MTVLADFARACHVAAIAHAGQVRKGRDGPPYINHPLDVARLVAEDGAGRDAVIAAVLHDTVEDTALTLAEIAADFGPEVAGLVQDLTNDPAWADLPRPEMKRLQAAHARGIADEARRIKIADQTSNVGDIARDPAAWTPGGARAYIAGSAEVVGACRDASPALARLFDAACRRAERRLEAVA